MIPSSCDAPGKAIGAFRHKVGASPDCLLFQLRITLGDEEQPTMLTLRAGDVIVRGHGHGTTAIFVIVEPVAQRMLSLPFKSLSSAFIAAQDLIASDGRVWYEQLDMFGCSIGSLIPLPPLRRRTGDTDRDRDGLKDTEHAHQC